MTGNGDFRKKKQTYYNNNNIDFIILNINLLLTEREGRTGEYWPEVVAVRTERSNENDRGPIFPCTTRASMDSK